MISRLSFRVFTDRGQHLIMIGDNTLQKIAHRHYYYRIALVLERYVSKRQSSWGKRIPPFLLFSFHCTSRRCSSGKSVWSTGGSKWLQCHFLRASSKLNPRPVFPPGLLPTEFSFVMFHLVCCWAFKTSQSIRIQLIIIAYLSLFLERSEHSIPSIRFVKHLSMAGCLSTCWLDMIFVLSLPKYYNKDNNAHVSEIHL